MKTNISDLKEIYKEYFEDHHVTLRESCPPPEAIFRCVRSDISKRQKSKIIDHIAECGSCAQEAKVILDITKEENHFIRGIEDFMNSRRLEKPREKRVFVGRLSWNTAAIAFSIILVAAIATSSILRLSSGSDSRRGAISDVRLISPVSQSLPAAQLKFVWQGFPKAKYYMIEAFDASLDLIWRSEPVRLNEAYAPEVFNEKFKPGETYYWMVTAVLEDGAKITSRQKEFRIKK